MKTTKALRVGAATAAVVAVAAVGVWVSQRPDAAKSTAAKPMPPVPVTVATAQIRDMPRRLEVVGRGEAFETVSLRARVDGQVLAVPFTEGQTVKTGDLLVRLDPADYQARLAQAEAAQARDQAQLAKAEADVERYVALKAKGFVSEEKVAEVRSTAQAMAATVRADRAAAELARLQLAYTEIRAPFGGLVGAKLVFPGAGVKTNDTVLAVVNRVKPLYVSFAVPESQLLRVKDALAHGPLAVDISLPGPNAPHFAGQARFIDNAVDNTTGTVQMKATVSNDESRLMPGQFVNVSLVLGTEKNAVVIPSEAVQQGPNGAYVFVVGPDDTVELRKLAGITTQAGLAVIGQGLQGNETVVTDGQLRLTPGARIQVKPAAKPTNAANGMEAAEAAPVATPAVAGGGAKGEAPAVPATGR